MSGRREIADNTPVEMPVGFKQPISLQERIKHLVRAEVSHVAASKGFETWDEANDFEAEDEIEPSSPHELVDDQEDSYLKDKQSFYKRVREEKIEAWRRKKSEENSAKAQPAPAPVVSPSPENK